MLKKYFDWWLLYVLFVITCDLYSNHLQALDLWLLNMQDPPMAAVYVPHRCYVGLHWLCRNANLYIQCIHEYNKPVSALLMHSCLSIMQSLLKTHIVLYTNHVLFVQVQKCGLEMRLCLCPSLHMHNNLAHSDSLHNNEASAWSTCLQILSPSYMCMLTGPCYTDLLLFNVQDSPVVAVYIPT